MVRKTTKRINSYVASRILNELLKYPYAYSSLQLADKTKFSERLINKTLVALEREGLIERQINKKEGPVHPRSITYSLTREGKSMMENAISKTEE